MNLEQARINMIKQQIQTWNVTDHSILELLQQVPREQFVPEEYKSLAFAEMEIPIGEGEVMLSPKLEARMLQALNLQAHEQVLEVGTGSGYFTALLAKRARHVFTVEIHGNLSRQAKTRLAALQIHNVSFDIGNAASSWPSHSPYDVIIITGSLPILPIQFKQQVRVGGRILAVIGDAPAMRVQLIERISDTEWQKTELFDTVIPPLLCAIQPSKFVF